MVTQIFVKAISSTSTITFYLPKQLVRHLTGSLTKVSDP